MKKSEGKSQRGEEKLIKGREREKVEMKIKGSREEKEEGKVNDGRSKKCGRTWRRQKQEGRDDVETKRCKRGEERGITERSNRVKDT